MYIMYISGLGKVFMNIVCALKLFFKFKQIYTNDFFIPNVEIYRNKPKAVIFCTNIIYTYFVL